MNQGRCSRIDLIPTIIWHIWFVVYETEDFSSIFKVFLDFTKFSSIFLLFFLSFPRFSQTFPRKPVVIINWKVKRCWKHSKLQKFHSRQSWGKASIFSHQKNNFHRIPSSINANDFNIGKKIEATKRFLSHEIDVLYDCSRTVCKIRNCGKNTHSQTESGKSF